MKHLKDEDIAGLIDGMATAGEREKYLEHLSHCQQCFNLYSETLKFIEQENLRVPERSPVKEQGLPGVKASFWEIFGKRKWLVPAASALLILLLLLPFLDTGQISDPRVQYLAGAYGQMPEHYNFSGSRDKYYSALRTGVYLADLALLDSLDSPRGIRKSIVALMVKDLEVLEFHNLELPGKIDASELERRLVSLMTGSGNVGESQLVQLLAWGRLLEEIILHSISNKDMDRTKLEQLEKGSLQLSLPRGVGLGLEKMLRGSIPPKVRESCEEIKELFF